MSALWVLFDILVHWSPYPLRPTSASHRPGHSSARSSRRPKTPCLLEDGMGAPDDTDAKPNGPPPDSHAPPAAQLSAELGRLRRALHAALAQRQHDTDALARAATTVQQQAAELVRVRAENAALRAEASAATARVREHRDEARALSVFLTKTDALSGADVLQAVGDLNAELVQLAASVADECAACAESGAGGPRAGEAERALVRDACGDVMLDLLERTDAAEDPAVVQLAIQAWLVRCCATDLARFGAGLTQDVERFMAQLFQAIYAAEPQAVACRWRALAHTHSRSILPTPTPSSSSSSSSSSAAYLRGMHAVLACARCPIPLSALSARFGAHAAQTGARAAALRDALATGVTSACFAVAGVDGGAVRFDAQEHEDVFAAYSSEGPSAAVLCATALGVACTRKRERELPPGDVDGDDEAGPDVLERTVLLRPKVVLESVGALF